MGFVNAFHAEDKLKEIWIWGQGVQCTQYPGLGVIVMLKWVSASGVTLIMGRGEIKPCKQIHAAKFAC